MRDELKRIAELQPEFSPLVTDAMTERGELVRNACPNWLRSLKDELSSAIGIGSTDFIAKGSDGQGSKAEIPWFRFASNSRSQSPTEGWYCVYLFESTGVRVQYH